MASLQSPLQSPNSNRKSRAYSENISFIPTPGEERPKPKAFVPFFLYWSVAGTAGLVMVFLGVALEAALSHSNSNNGFAVPQKNVFSFASVSFLTSFFPTLLVVPLSLFWTLYQGVVKRYQPYITLSRGNAKAEDSLLVDYIIDNNFVAAFRAIGRKHWMVLATILGGIASLMYQPLAGSVFNIRQVPHPEPSEVISMKSLGLLPTWSQLDGFMSAAAYVEAAVGLGLPDPPFIKGSWAVADFTFPPGQTLNGSIIVNTTAIQTTSGCAAPTNLTLQPVAGSNNITLTATSPSSFAGDDDSCTATLSLDTTIAVHQYGVISVPQCGSSQMQNSNSSFQPVFFWFFSAVDEDGDDTPLGAGVFCSPSVAVYEVMGNSNLVSGACDNVTVVDQWHDANNVTGAPLSGLVFNGVIFDNITDPYVQKRAIAINSGVPAAIFKNVTSQSLDVQRDAFSSSNFSGFLGFVDSIYTQYLAISAKSVYFVPANDSIPSTTVANIPRLFLQGPPSHALAAILLITGALLLLTQFSHWRARRHLMLSVAPGSIASTIALTSHSGFGYLLFPYDDEYTMRHKLAGLTFRLDKRTGAIACQDAFEQRIHPTLARADGSGSGSDTEMGLLKDVDGQKQEPASPAIQYNSR